MPERRLWHVLADQLMDLCRSSIKRHINGLLRVVNMVCCGGLILSLRGLR
jgi:hypothetical protein